AIMKCGDEGKETVGFLKKQIERLRIDAKRVKALLAALASDKEMVWRPAFEELEYFDPRLAIDLETLMNDVTEAPARQRLAEVLSGRPAGSLAGKQITLRRVVQSDGFNFSDGTGSWWAEHKVTRINNLPWALSRKKWTRAIRAIVLLEHIGTPDAAAVLTAMASGHPDAQPTVAAAEALK